jgi:Tol biopolymer transport system component
MKIPRQIASTIFLCTAFFACNDAEIMETADTWDLAGRVFFQPQGNGPYQSGGVWVLDLNTPDANVTIAYPAGYAFRLSMDGKKIVAVGPPSPSDTWGLFTVALDQLVVSKIPRSGRYLEWDPAWSPDAKKIAFLAEFTALGAPHPYAISTINSDGTDFQAITDTTQSQSPPSWPTWSPDGSKIAYIRNLQPGSPSPALLALILPDGSGQEDLGDAYAPYPPRWSNDGRMIAYGRFLTNPGDTNATRVFIYDTQSGTANQLAPDAELTPWGLTWLISGELACIGNDYNGQPLAGGLSILVCSPTTRQVEKILVSGGFLTASLISSPDGIYVGILGIRSEEEGYSFFVVRSDGTGFRFIKTLMSYSDFVLQQHNVYWVQ